MKMNTDAIEAKYISLKEAFRNDNNLSFYQIHGITFKENYHSKFIAFFLNLQKNKFGQEFLDRFIKMLEKHIPDDNHDKKLERPFSYKKVITDRGKKIDRNKISGGRPDIGILNNNPDKHIVIENKINAIHQPAQLVRYKNMEEYKNATIVYLNPLDEPAPSDSLGDIKDNEYIIISYNDIIEWIKDCINYFNDNNKEEKANKIYFYLNDYLEAVEAMVKKKTEVTKIHKEILPLLAEDLDDFFTTYDELRKEKNVKLSDFKKRYLRNAVPLKKYLIREKFINIILVALTDNIGEGFKWKLNDGRDIMEKGWGFQFYKEKWKKANITISFYFKKNNLEDCNFGLRNFNKKEAIPDYFRLEFKDKETKSGYCFDKENKLKGYSNWHREIFYEFMSDEEIIEKTPFFEKIKNIVDEMCEEIDKVIINYKP